MGSAANIKTVPRKVLWMIEAQECYDFSGSTASGLGGQYVSIYLPDGTGFYTFFDENNTDTDPVPGGLTLISVDYAASATPSAIATAFAAAVQAASGLTAAVVSGTTTTVRVYRDAVGPVTASAGTATSVVISVERLGKNVDLGLTEGDIDAGFAPSILDVTAHQTGTVPVASVGIGFEAAEIEIVLLETETSKLKEFYTLYGGAFTPGGGTEIFGMGTGFLGASIDISAARLVFKPVNAVDNSENINCMLATPVPSSFLMSGENPQKLTVTFKCKADTTFNSNANYVAYGDIFQAGL